MRTDIRITKTSGADSYKLTFASEVVLLSNIDTNKYRGEAPFRTVLTAIYIPAPNSTGLTVTDPQAPFMEVIVTGGTNAKALGLGGMYTLIPNKNPVQYAKSSSLNRNLITKNSGGYDLTSQDSPGSDGIITIFLREVARGKYVGTIELLASGSNRVPYTITANYTPIAVTTNTGVGGATSVGGVHATQRWVLKVVLGEQAVAIKNRGVKEGVYRQEEAGGDAAYYSIDKKSKISLRSLNLSVLESQSSANGPWEVAVRMFDRPSGYSGRLGPVIVQGETDLPGFSVELIQETAEEMAASIAQERAVAAQMIITPGGEQQNQITPAESRSQTTIACTALKDLPSSHAVSNEDKPSSCDESSSSRSVQVTVKRGTDTVRVTLYERAAKWEGYGLVAQATQATAGLNGVYVYVSNPVPVPLSVTCVWHESNGGYVKDVYMANLTGLSGTLYTYTLKHTSTDAVVTMEVPKGAVGPFDPTQEQIDAAACAALGSKFTGEELQCPPPVGARADVVAIVTVVATLTFTARVKLYKYTRPASFWAGYGRAANSGALTGVYVKISSTGDVMCVWDSDTSANVKNVEYNRERVPSASTSTSTSQVSDVYKLTSGTDNVTLVHDSGPSPFPPLTPKEAAEDTKKEAELAEKTAAACNELKKKLDWVVCGSTSTVTSTVMVMRGTAAVPVTLHYDATSKLWTGYGLSTGSAGTGPKGLYVAVSTDAQGVAVVKCVWDTNPIEVGDYRATLQDRTARIYTLVAVSPTGPTSVGKEPVSVLVRSVQSPFPSEQETPKPVAPAPAPSSLSTEAIIGIVVGSVAGFILIVVLVVLWVRSRKKVAPYSLPTIDGLMDRFSFLP
jgi:hypothetical protein